MNLLKTPDKKIDAFTNAMNVDKTGLFVIVEEKDTIVELKIFNNVNNYMDKKFTVDNKNSIFLEVAIAELQIGINNYWLDLPKHIRKQIGVTYQLWINSVGETQYEFKQN